LTDCGKRKVGETAGGKSSQSIKLESLGVEIEVRQIYQLLEIPIGIEDVGEPE
jgi:hypothetical protein